MIEIIRNCVQIVVACLEIWLCYQVVYVTVVNKEYLTMLDKGAIWFNIIGIGILLAINRNLLFFSDYMFIICVVITWIFVVRIERKRIFLILSIILSFYSLVSLLDFLLAFISMLELQEQFDSKIYIEASSAAQVIIFVCSRFIIMFGVFLLRKNEKIKKNIEEYKNILIGISIILCIIVKQNQYTLEGMSSGKYEMRPGNAGFTLVIVIIMLLLVEVLLFKNKIVKQENEYLILRDHMNEKMYLEMKQFNEKSRELSHDMKKYLLVLSKYEKERNWEMLREYLSELTREVDSNDIPIWTGNKVLDFLLYQKIIEAEKKGIEFQIQTISLVHLPFNTSEICSLFGNLLDNAIEACERIERDKKWIEFKMNKRENLLFVKIANSIKERPIIEDGNWVSLKLKKDMHGYGMKCVKRIIDKYEGMMECQTDRGKIQIYLTFYDVGKEEKE